MYVAGVVLTTIIASAATAPLAIYHFGRLPTFSILANVVAVPLTAFWIMPSGLVGMLLLPLDLAGSSLAGWCFALMGVGICVRRPCVTSAASAPGCAEGPALAMPGPDKMLGRGCVMPGQRAIGRSPTNTLVH
jgi:competence protein ComEC